jgi:hypothetical protein
LIPGRLNRLNRPKKVAKSLAAFWSATKENIPEAFLIQKTAAMFAFNSFIAPIFGKNEKFAGVGRPNELHPESLTKMKIAVTQIS